MNESDPGKTIGRCECIYSFDKMVIAQALGDLIAKNEEFLRKIEETPEEEFTRSPLGDRATMTATYKQILYSFRTVKERVEASPDCEAMERK